MRLCAERITDCEGGGLCQRYGWTGRGTARVAHKRAGRRLRLQGDLERFPTLLRPLRSLRAPVEGLRWRHKETHLAPVRPLHPDAHKDAPSPPALCAVSRRPTRCYLLRAVLHKHRSPRVGRSSWVAAGVGPWQRCRLARLLTGRSAGWIARSLECLVSSARSAYAAP